MITIEIEIKDRNRIKEFFQNFHSKAEDILFSTISKIPEKLIPSPIMNWLDRNMDKQIGELKQQIIKQRWQQDSLEKAVSDIRSINQDTKKHLQMISSSVGAFSFTILSYIDNHKKK